MELVRILSWRNCGCLIDWLYRIWYQMYCGYMMYRVWDSHCVCTSRVQENWIWHLPRFVISGAGRVSSHNPFTNVLTCNKTRTELGACWQWWHYILCVEYRVSYTPVYSRMQNNTSNLDIHVAFYTINPRCSRHVWK